METPTHQAFKLAMIQMLVEPGALKANLKRARARIAMAATSGATIALLPELMDLGWTHPSVKDLAAEIPHGNTCQALCEMASHHGVYVCAGLSEKVEDKTYNSAVIINPTGKVILKHRKINELQLAHDLYHCGDRLNVVETSLGRFGLYICADALADQNTLSTGLGYMGADIILSPCAWAVPPDFDNQETPYGDLWREAYRPVSNRFNLWVLGVSSVGRITAGPWKDWRCIGSSLAFAPGGREVLQAPFGSGADIIEFIDVVLPHRLAWSHQPHNPGDW